MPEIAEVARIVHYLRKTVVGKTLAAVKAQDDANVFGKVGTTGAEFQTSLTGKKVLDAGRQGKYFWLIMSSPPHPVFHLGMTGWIFIRGEPTAHYRPKEPEDQEEWPPKYWKFILETDSKPKVEAAFSDARRFGRVRLVNCAAKDIRDTSPLKENGPDPTIDMDVLTEEWLEKKMKSKHVPVKALLLDQANISGIGNWVGDEILYNAKLHPEQYSDTFSSAQLKQLHRSILYVCQTAVELLADSSKFPEDWLFKHRWGKGKKDSATTLPNGAKLTFLTVGGRTSCVVPSVQKKTGAVAGDLKKEPTEKGEESLAAKKGDKSNGTKNGKDVLKIEGVEAEYQEERPVEKEAKSNVGKKRKIVPKAESDVEDEANKTTKKHEAAKAATSKAPKKRSKATEETVEVPSGSRRRAGRVSNPKV